MPQVRPKVAQDGPQRASWDRLGAVLGQSWGPLGALLEPLGAILGRLGAVLEPSWGPFGAFGGHLEPILAVLTRIC